jgi:4-nitrophenyl phosphatase
MDSAGTSLTSSARTAGDDTTIQPMPAIKLTAGVILDMDGVLWRGDESLPGMAALFERLYERNLPFVLATNNSMKAPVDYVAKLAKFGVSGVEPSRILTSGVVAVDYLKAHYPPDTPIHVLGGDGLKALIVAAGYPLHYMSEDKASVVVAGLDTRATYDKFKRATLQLRAGAAFIGTNDDVTLPTPEGLAPGAGSLLALLTAASGREPMLMGKPNPAMFEAALKILGTPPAQTLMIGDRLDTDIFGASRVGIRTALVLTGVSTRAEAEQGAIQPDAIYDDLQALLAAWS